MTVSWKKMFLRAWDLEDVPYWDQWSQEEWWEIGKARGEDLSAWPWNHTDEAHRRYDERRKREAEERDAARYQHHVERIAAEREAEIAAMRADPNLNGGDGLR